MAVSASLPRTPLSLTDYGGLASARFLIEETGRFGYLFEMQTALYPLTFRPIYRDYLWGGTRIAKRFDRVDVPTRCAESWEVSAHADGMSIVEDGALKGRDLAGLCKEHGVQLLGTACESDRFPLLIKLIDARERLSVQVHPDDEAAARYGGEAKTEMWHILECEPDSVLFAGLQEGVGPRIFHDAVVERRVASLLRSIPSVAGKSLYTPGGMVHAIGEGNLLLEIQQNSNTTYRVYDWDRAGPDGRGRELHVQQAMEVIDWRAPAIGLLTPIPMPGPVAANRHARLLRSDFFELSSLHLAQAERVGMDGLSFHALFVAEGTVQVGWGTSGEMVSLPCGRSCLLPASLVSYELTPMGGAAARVLTTTV
jgi:mannose-6-phosphate isomerase